MSGQRNHKPRFEPQSAFVNKKQVCMRLGMSEPAFDKIRPEMELDGFPRKDNIIGRWHYLAVEKWIAKRGSVMNEDEMEIHLAMESARGTTAQAH